MEDMIFHNYICVWRFFFQIIPVGNTRFILAGPDYGWASLTVAQGAESKGAPNQFGTLRNVVNMFFFNHTRKQSQHRGGVFAVL
jgi:hypothetical protein